MSSFRFLIGEEASRQILWLPADEQWSALRAIEVLVQHPITDGLAHWRAEDGRTHYIREVRGWLVTFWVDDAERVVRILAIDQE